MLKRRNEASAIGESIVRLLVKSEEGASISKISSQVSDDRLGVLDI